MSQKKYASGAVYRVPLEREPDAIGIVINEPLMAFFAGPADGGQNIEGALQGAPLFKVCVAKAPMRTGRWQYLGVFELPQVLREPVWFYRMDIGTLSTSICGIGIDLSLDNARDRPAAASECRGLEIFSVWSDVQVEGRLKDSLDGRPNKFVEHERKRLEKAMLTQQRLH